MTTTTAVLSGTYAVDPTPTRIGFVTRHAMVTKVRGAFEGIEGTAVLDFDDPPRRAAALRKQHDLDVRKPGEALPPVPHLEKHLQHYANAGMVLGVLLVLIGALR